MDLPEDRQECAAARTAAFRLLKIRPRSVLEIRDKLTAKGLAADVINETVAFLLEKKFLDDRAFARSWIRFRLERPFGIRRIAFELQQKGISPDILEDELDALPEEYSEQEVVLALARRRAQRMTGVDPIKRKKRIMDYLSRRGFRLETIRKAVARI